MSVCRFLHLSSDKNRIMFRDGKVRREGLAFIALVFIGVILERTSHLRSQALDTPDD